jgi:hypothetical protein
LLGYGLGGMGVGIKKEIFSSLECTGKKSIYSCDVKFGFFTSLEKEGFLVCILLGISPTSDCD